MRVLLHGVLPLSMRYHTSLVYLKFATDFPHLVSLVLFLYFAPNKYKKMRTKNSIFVLLGLMIAAVVSTSCSKSESDNTTPQQQIVTTDSSEFNGRLKAEVRNVNNNLENNAIVYLYANYSDLVNNLSLNFVYTNNSGIADFGYLLQGNYYLLA